MLVKTLWRNRIDMLIIISLIRYISKYNTYLSYHKERRLLDWLTQYGLSSPSVDSYIKERLRTQYLLSPQYWVSQWPQSVSEGLEDSGRKSGPDWKAKEAGF